MEHHLCAVPAPGAAVDRPGPGLRADRWQCPECRWVWRLNPLVHRWFRDPPARAGSP